MAKVIIIGAHMDMAHAIETVLQKNGVEASILVPNQKIEPEPMVFKERIIIEDLAVELESNYNHNQKRRYNKNHPFKYHK